MSNPSIKRFSSTMAIAIGLLAQNTAACDFPAPSITAYATANPDYVVFVGTAMSTTRFWQRWFGAPKASLFKVSAWYAGSKRAQFVTVLHIPVPDPAIFYCGPVRGFIARKGEQLVIVGRQVGNVIAPEAPLIRPVNSTAIPVELARELDAVRRSPPR